MCRVLKIWTIPGWFGNPLQGTIVRLHIYMYFFTCAYMYICIIYICIFLQGTVVRLSHWLDVFLSKTLQFSHWLHVFLSKTHGWIGWRETHWLDGEKHIQSMCTYATQLPTPNLYRTRVLCEGPQNPQCIFEFLCSHATKLLTPCMYGMRALSETSQNSLCIFRISDVTSCAMHFATHTPEVYNTRVSKYVFHTTLCPNFWYNVVLWYMYRFQHPIYTTKGCQNV